MAGSAVVAGLGLGALASHRLQRRDRRDCEDQRVLVRKLQDLEQAKADFVSTVSHELRTPLTNIVGYVETLREREFGDVSPEQDRVLSVIGRNTERLQGLIEDLLTLSHIEADDLELTFAPVELGEVVRSALARLAPTIAERRQRLLTHIDEPLPAVTGDAHQLERVVHNLVGNAVKFTPEGGHITVSLGVGRDDGLVTLTVTDTGVGIPESEQHQVFSRFFRASPAHEQAIPGTGLGLVLVKEIVDRHGGSVSMTSSPDGSTFVVRLPTTAAPAARAARGRTPA